MKIQATTTYKGPTVKDDGWECYEYAVRLRHSEGRTMRTRFYVGTGWTTAPSASDILESLLSDAASVQYEDVDGWIEEYGLEINNIQDARRYEKMYADIERQTKRLERFLGDDYQTATNDPEAFTTKHADHKRRPA